MGGRGESLGGDPGPSPGGFVHLLYLCLRLSQFRDTEIAQKQDKDALAESIIGLYKTELIRKRGPWKNLDIVEYATLEWVDWFNHRRLLETIGYIPPAELEEMFYREQRPAEAAGLKQLSLH